MTIKPKLLFDPGPIVVTIAMEAVAGLPNVKELIFITNGAVVCVDGHISRGRWDLPTGTITIDLAECIRQLDWVHKGMFVTHNIWYNVLYAIYHEVAHAWQCFNECWEEGIPLDADIEGLEKEAHDYATDKVMNWFTNNKLPNLKEMGDLGEEIKRLRNTMYAMDNQHVLDEQRVLGTDAAGKADVVVALRGNFSEEGVQDLFDRIDEGGYFGCVINGTRYLKAEEIIAD